MKRTACVALILMLVTGCGRLVAIDYEAANRVKGEGVLRVAPFKYEPSEMHRVRPRQVETHPESKTELFMVGEVAGFFADALKKEYSSRATRSMIRRIGSCPVR